MGINHYSPLNKSDPPSPSIWLSPRVKSPTTSHWQWRRTWPRDWRSEIVGFHRWSWDEIGVLWCFHRVFSYEIGVLWCLSYKTMFSICVHSFSKDFNGLHRLFVGFDRCSHRFSQLFLAINGGKGTGASMVNAWLLWILGGFSLGLPSIWFEHQEVRLKPWEDGELRGFETRK